MTDISAARVHETTASDDVQELLDRIADLEERLNSRARAERKRGATSPWLLVSTGTLAAANVVIAFPAYLTVRRWYRWWN
jgi:hypothetical protein